MQKGASHVCLWKHMWSRGEVGQSAPSRPATRSWWFMSSSRSHLSRCPMWWTCMWKFLCAGPVRACVCVCCSHPRRQALWRCWRDCFSVGSLGRAQLGRHCGRLIYVGQRLGAVLRLAVLCAVPLIAICVVVEVWRWKQREAEKEMKRRPTTISVSIQKSARARL